MIGAAQRYQELLVDLMLQRRLAGGALDPSVESELVEALDRCWRAMSDTEQDEAEQLFEARSHVLAPDDLGLADQPVIAGAGTAPRRAA
jgi:hypothetical protein